MVERNELEDLQLSPDPQASVFCSSAYDITSLGLGSLEDLQL